MARIRTIKPEFWQDEKLSPLAPLDRLVFLGLICMADDAGRVLDNAKVIDAFIFPSTDDRSHESLMRLSARSRIERGVTASGQPVVQILNWQKHQRVQHPSLKSCLPPIAHKHKALPAPSRDSHESRPSENGGPHEVLAPHTTDQRPTTNDLRAEEGAAAATPEALGLEALADYLRSARNPRAIRAEVQAALTGMHPPQRSESEVWRALHEMAVAGVHPFTAAAFRGFLRRVAEAPANGSTPRRGAYGELDQLLQKLADEAEEAP